MEGSFSKISFNKDTKAKIKKLDAIIGVLSALTTLLVSYIIFSINDFQFASSTEYVYTSICAALGLGLFFTRNEAVGAGIIVGIGAFVSAAMIIF